MTRVGLFGGTFDPVHNGHVSIAQSFLHSGLIDELWVLLTPFPPHKLEQKHVSYEQRLELVRTAFGQQQHLEILTIENELPKPSYTYQTIAHLKNDHPDHKFYYCMGEDSLVNFHQWKYYDRILEQADLIVARRPGESHLEVLPEILRKVHFVDHMPIEAASSEIRARIEKGDDVSDILPPAVLEKIDKDQLYR